MRIPVRECNDKWQHSLPVKAEGFYKTLICGVALQTAPLNVCIIRLAIRFLRALQLNVFEQSKTKKDSIITYSCFLAR
jgi:hypothetical protein